MGRKCLEGGGTMRSLRVSVGLVNTHPLEVGSKGLKFVASVRDVTCVQCIARQ
ncbi:hypothetical protein GW17_00049026 [Ensete ventricosum]|nr:hypothetical protein GW17_00049026 [Ensete ventricosum]